MRKPSATDHLHLFTSGSGLIAYGVARISDPKIATWRILFLIEVSRVQAFLLRCPSGSCIRHSFPLATAIENRQRLAGPRPVCCHLLTSPYS